MSKANAELFVLTTMAPVVVATRTMDMVLSAAGPTARSRREANLMVSEKAVAFVESVFAVNLALMEIGARSAGLLSRPPDVTDFMHYADDLIAASLRPYASKVRANRSRLAKRRDGRKA